MWIVRLALRRPYTVAVMALLMLVMGVLSLTRMIVDIFPAIDIPVVLVAWNYPGLSAEEMERRVVIISERAYSTTVNGIERIESQSIPGVGILKVYFQPGTDIGAAIAQISSVSSTLLHIAPPGMQPPNVIQFNASNVPVAQLTMSSQTLSEQEIDDYALNFIRVRLFTIPGLSTPAPFGGKQREIMVAIDPAALAAKSLSPADVVTALQTSNVIEPAGSARIGKTDYNILTNSSPSLVEQFDAIPVKVVGSAPVLLGDVAKVSDSFAVQNNIVHINGSRAAYLAILKHADASTLAVVDAVRNVLPSVRAVAPRGLNLKIDFDQSVFVRAAIGGVVRETILAALLVSLMILVFLGSWRSMVIVTTSIPLAIFTAIIGLKLTNNSINIMTLGGLALAVGMLVDDATVEVENIHRNRTLGKPLTIAILDGARQIAVPAIVATLSICIVFFPVVLLYGPAKFLFTPLALAVVLAMLASYLLSRTLVPTLARMLMAGERHVPGALESGSEIPPAEPDRPTPDAHESLIGRFAFAFNRARDRAFESFRNAYGGLLAVVLAHRAYTLGIAVVLFVVSAGLLTVIGTDLFPSVDVGMMKLHFRAPTGMRIEETERMVARVEKGIRQIIPPDEVDTINDMIGVPIYYNLAFVQTENIAGMDSEILISLKPHHHPTSEYERRLRQVLPQKFPSSQFWFQPADIVTQVLNFGLAAPIDVQVEGNDFSRSYTYARSLRDAMREVPGVADVHVAQVLDYPALKVNVDRVRAAELGLSQRDVANTVLIALSSSSLVSPNFFLNPANNVNYTVAVQVPIRQIDSVRSLLSTPLTPPEAATLLQPASLPSPTSLPEAPAETLGNVATVHPEVSPGEINHYTVQRVLDVEGSADGRDMGSVIHDIRQKIAGLGKMPPGMRINVRGQNQVMEESFRSLLEGLALSIVLVYFLMVILFQSWLDPFIIMMAVPGALVGILWMLALTGTTINVESLMGSIMAVGIAVSNSILLVSFANDLRVEHAYSAIDAALEAGKTRLRPVLMTALAMIIGMMPMALSYGEGGEQNAPLGRAVIGGLAVATFVTLFVVPVVYSLLRTKLPSKHVLEERFLAEERGERTRKALYDEFGG
ncbi:MAG TPA: efflux RND transporter permease subunit [Terriglobia bacterium]|nr:efflux RND transporter permease subunit [Terriglobia bacterium]